MNRFTKHSRALTVAVMASFLMTTGAPAFASAALPASLPAETLVQTVPPATTADQTGIPDAPVALNDQEMAEVTGEALPAIVLRYVLRFLGQWAYNTVKDMSREKFCNYVANRAQREGGGWAQLNDVLTSRWTWPVNICR